MQEFYREGGKEWGWGWGGGCLYRCLSSPPTPWINKAARQGVHQRPCTCRPPLESFSASSSKPQAGGVSTKPKGKEWGGEGERDVLHLSSAPGGPSRTPANTALSFSEKRPRQTVMLAFTVNHNYKSCAWFGIPCLYFHTFRGTSSLVHCWAYIKLTDLEGRMGEWI